MIMRTIPLLALSLGVLTLSAHGQGASRLSQPSTADSKKQLQEAAEKLRQARESGQLDQARETAKGLLNNIPGGLTETAKAAMQSPEVKAQAAEAARAAAKSLLPEAQRMMSGGSAAVTDATSQPAAGAQGAAVQNQPPAAEGPKPQPLQPLDAPPAPGTPAPSTTAANRKVMAVVEADNSVFEKTTGVLIYTGNVRARHPQFYIECEELIIHLNPEEDAKDSPSPGKNDAILKQGEKPNPVKKAIATGPMIKIEKADPEGKVQRAFCRHATYDGATGMMTMRDNPMVQRDNIMQMATSPDTVMTFDKNGKFSSNRPTKTTILSEENAPGTPGANP